jgi:type II secretory pathway pseudopilin PulG
MKMLLMGLLAVSLALNVFLWGRVSNRTNELKSAQAALSELDELRRQNEELQVKRASVPDAAGADIRELARLRNEVAQLRKKEAATSSAQAVEAAQLRARLTAATQQLAHAETELAEGLKVSPEELQQLKQEAQSVGCVNNLKQIGLAARIWANDHNDVFPPDFITMKDELNTPKILFCPGDPAAIRVTDWSQLNPSSISYRFLNPNGNETDPNKPLATCPIHGHVGLSDGSVRRQ